MSTSIQLELHDFERQANQAETNAARIEEKIERLEHPHRDESILRELYWERELSLAEAGDELSCDEKTVRHWFRKKGIETRDPPGATAGPWREKATLERLYIEEKKPMEEIAAELGCTTGTVRRNIHKNDIPTRNGGEGCRVERAGYFVDPEGYPACQAWEPYNGTVSVGVHRLVACLDNDPHEIFGEENNADCHHVTGHKLANVPGLIEVVSRSKHMSLHHNGSYEYNEDGWPILVTQEGGGDE